MGMAKGLRGLTVRAPSLACVLGLFLIGGCAAEGPRPAAAAAAPIGEQVFSVGFSRIAEIYLNPVDLGQIGTDGLSGLSKLDPAFKVEREGAVVRVTVDGTLAGTFPAPAPYDAEGWSQVTAQAIDSGRSLSRTLGEAPADQIVEAVFDAIMADLDSYSRYSGPSRAGQERAQREGFGGIGLTIDAIDGRMLVRAVEAKSPADRVGIRGGDVVSAIDGQSTAGLTLSQVVERLRGPIGSTVRVTLDEPPFRTLVLRRERVIPNTVTLTLTDRIAVLKLERFNAATTSNLREAVATAKQKLGRHAIGYVLDLRGNPGGLLDQAVAVADLFIRRGRIISTAGRHPDSWQRFDAAADDLLDGQPMVVLVDGRSASASEIVAAALQDSRRAVVVGASSFGKGSVQTVTRLPNDGELFLTWSRLYAPSGYTLHRQGVQPTLCTSRDDLDAQTIMDEFRRGGPPLPPSTLAAWRDAAADDDEALAKLRAACPWKAHEPALDVAVAESLLTDHGLYLSALNMTVVAER